MEVIKKYILQRPLLTKGGVILILSLFAIGLFTPFHSAEAFGFGDILGFFKKIFDTVFGLIIALPAILIYIVLTVIILIFGFLPVFFSALILNLVLSDSLITFQYTSGGIVDVGWIITRDLANLFFVAIIIIIAIGTILGQQNRNIRLLPQLIFVALIINFTKVIAGLIVDFANIVTNYFLSPLKDIGNLFINLFLSASPIWQVISALISLFTDFSLSLGFIKRFLGFFAEYFSFEALVTQTISTAMIVIVGLLIAFTLFIFTGIFLMRYIMIWLLVILSPLAFAASILPDTKTYFTKWWTAFIHWCFIGVGPAFVLFLIAKIIEKLNELDPPGISGISKAAIDDAVEGAGILTFFLLPLYPVINSLLLWAVILIMMWTGLQMTLSLNAKVSNKMVKWGKRAAGAAGSGVNNFVKAKRGKSITEDVGERMVKTRIPNALGGEFVRKAGKRMLTNAEREERKKWEEEREESKSISTTASNLALMSDPKTGVIKYVTALQTELGRRNGEKNVRQFLASGTVAEQDAKKTRLEGMIYNASLAPGQKDDAVLQYLPEFAYARHGASIDADGTDLSAQAAAGTLTMKEAKSASYMRYEMNEEERRKMSAPLFKTTALWAALGDKSIEYANSDEKMQGLLENLEGQSNPNNAREKMADMVLSKKKYIKQIPNSFLQDLLFVDKLADREDKLSEEYVKEFSNEHGKTNTEKILKQIRWGPPPTPPGQPTPPGVWDDYKKRNPWVVRMFPAIKPDATHPRALLGEHPAPIPSTEFGSMPSQRPGEVYTQTRGPTIQRPSGILGQGPVPDVPLASGFAAGAPGTGTPEEILPKRKLGFQTQEERAAEEEGRKLAQEQEAAETTTEEEPEQAQPKTPEQLEQEAKDEFQKNALRLNQLLEKGANVDDDERREKQKLVVEFSKILPTVSPIPGAPAKLTPQQEKKNAWLNEMPKENREKLDELKKSVREMQTEKKVEEFNQLKADYEKIPVPLYAAIEARLFKIIKGALELDMKKNKFLVASPAKRLWTAVAGGERGEGIGFGPIRPAPGKAAREAWRGIKETSGAVKETAVGATEATRGAMGAVGKGASHPAETALKAMDITKKTFGAAGGAVKRTFTGQKSPEAIQEAEDLKNLRDEYQELSEERKEEMPEDVKEVTSALDALSKNYKSDWEGEARAKQRNGLAENLEDKAYQDEFISELAKEVNNQQEKGLQELLDFRIEKLKELYDIELLMQRNQLKKNDELLGRVREEISKIRNDIKQRTSKKIEGIKGDQPTAESAPTEPVNTEESPQTQSAQSESQPEEKQDQQEEQKEKEEEKKEQTPAPKPSGPYEPFKQPYEPFKPYTPFTKNDEDAQPKQNGDDQS